MILKYISLNRQDKIKHNIDNKTPTVPKEFIQWYLKNITG